MTKPFMPATEYAKNERAEKLLTQPPGSKANVPDKEVTHMLCCEQYGDSAPKCNPDTWQSIGELARKLAEKAGGSA